MKGIAHFVTGVAVASFFPDVVHSASHNLSFAPLLGGFAGLLPDTLDFKFVRYFQRLDDEIDPAQITDGSGRPDPQAIAERIAAAMGRAYEGGDLVSVQLHTVRLGADLWRQWSVTFDLERNGIKVAVGPAVTTAQVPMAGSELAGLKAGWAPVGPPILHTYDAEIQIDIFSGPSLAFQRAGETLEVTFLPWHRAWSHSLLMALALGMVGALFAPVVGLVMALAVLAHIAEDLMGFMGSNLLFPLTRRRTMGIGLLRSGDAIPNAMVVWVSLTIILLNLDRFSSAPVIPVGPYVAGVIIAPCLALLGLGAWELLGARRQPAVVLAAVEALDETGEIDI